MRLVRSELRRAFSRRITWVTAIALMAGAILMTVAFSISLSQQHYDPVAQRANYEQAVKDWNNGGKASCEKERADQAAQGAPTDGWACEAPKEEWFVYSPWRDMARVLPMQIAMITGVAAFVVGASLAGAEIASGSLGNLLTFETRRSRVYSARLAAAGAVGLALAAESTVVLWGLMWIVARMHHIPTTLTSGLGVHLMWSTLRAVAAVGAGAIGAAALAFITKHTAAVMGVVAGYLIFGEAVLSISAWTRQHLTQYFLSQNLQGWVEGRAQRSITGTCITDASGITNCHSIDIITTWQRGGLELLIVMLAVALIGWAIFRRRDVAN